jgi:hypothetical protein
MVYERIYKKGLIMNPLVKTAAFAAIGCLICLISGCASSSLVNIWHDNSFKNTPLNKMLVVAIRKDATKRRIWEDALAGELVKHGVAVTTSYSLFPDSPPDTDQVIKSVIANNFDGILLIRRLPTETDKQYIQGYTSMEQNVQYNFYWQRYWTYYSEIEHPGYIDSQTVAISAIDVSTTQNGGHLIWSATSRTPDPGLVTDIQHGIADLVVSDLAQLKIINSTK